ncbi:MAG TPA: hypothetical protein VLG48_00140 [Candidatus Methylomirabilis sp.]|nr:hypothetical protein [Candidatus Methylomirabilis sp.]
MKKPKWRLLHMLLGLVLFLAIVAGVNWVADPYGAWQVRLVDRVYMKDRLEMTRVITPYRLRTKQPITLLIGASRVFMGMPIEQGDRDGVLNASLMGGTLDEIAAIVQVAIRQPKLQRLVWGVEFFTFDEAWAGIHDPKMPRRLDGDTQLRLLETLLTMEVLDESRKLFLRAIGGRKRLPATRSVPVPWPEDVIREGLEEARQHGRGDSAPTIPEHAITQWVDIYSNYRISPRQMALFTETLAEIKRAGIEAIVFVPALREYELEVIRQSGHWAVFQQWKRQLAAAGPYWDFSGYNEMAAADYLYGDVAHFIPAAGNTILRLLLGEGCAACGELAHPILKAGVRVDARTLEDHLAEGDARRIARTQRETRFSRAVEDLIRRKAIPVAGRPH